MMKKMVIITALLTAGFTALLTANPMSNGIEGQGLRMYRAQGSMNKHMMRKHLRASMHANRDNPMRLFRTIRKELNLTTQQRQKIRDIMIDQRIKRLEMKKRKPLKNKEEMRLDMSKFMSKDKFDTEAFKKLMNERAAKRIQQNQARRTERLNMMAETMEKIFNVLTPQQREKLIQLSQKEKK